MTSQRSGGTDDGASVDDEAIAATIANLLDRRGPTATICPSDVARVLWTDEAEWRAAMPSIRRVAAVMARDGLLVATRRGKVVDPEGAGGPIRLGRPR